MDSNEPIEDAGDPMLGPADPAIKALFVVKAPVWLQSAKGPLTLTGGPGLTPTLGYSCVPCSVAWAS